MARSERHDTHSRWTSEDGTPTDRAQHHCRDKAFPNGNEENEPLHPAPISLLPPAGKMPPPRPRPERLLPLVRTGRGRIVRHLTVFCRTLRPACVGVCVNVVQTGATRASRRDPENWPARPPTHLRDSPPPPRWWSGAEAPEPAKNGNRPSRDVGTSPRTAPPPQPGRVWFGAEIRWFPLAASLHHRLISPVPPGRRISGPTFNHTCVRPPREFPFVFQECLRRVGSLFFPPQHVPLAD